MDGEGRYLEYIFIERLWRTLKYEWVYLHAWQIGSQVRTGVRTWMKLRARQGPWRPTADSSLLTDSRSNATQSTGGDQSLKNARFCP